MKILVLGAGGSGGLPRWNCACAQCQGLRHGDGAAPMTQSSVAISADGKAWVLVNASPDIAQQIRANPPLQPALQPTHSSAATGPGGSSPIKAVVLLDSQLQSVAGLLSLRESQQLEVYATPMVFEDLTDGLPLLPVLEQYCAVRWHPLPVAGTECSAEFSIPGFEALRFMAMAVPGRTPPHARQREASVGDNVALWVEDLRSAQSFVFAPVLAHAPEAGGPRAGLSAELADGTDAGDADGAWLLWLQEADCWLLDAQGRWPSHELGGRRIVTQLGHEEAAPPWPGDAALERAYDGMVIEL